MPGDPKECRQHALNCVRLAQTSSTPQAIEEFASLANTWLRLAADLEQARAFSTRWMMRTNRSGERARAKEGRPEADAPLLLGRALINRRQMLTWIGRPRSAIGSKADMARTCQYVC
jgi:hypothetical protein